MANYEFDYWQRRLEDCAKTLEKHGFRASVAADSAEAAAMIRQQVKEWAPRSVGYADSQTLKKTGVLEWLRQEPNWNFIDGFDKTKSRDENLEVRRQALLTDLFLTGVNAVTEQGTLVWLDMVGNRIGGVNFGPRNVILAVGRNKLTGSLDEALKRVKSIAAPMNARAHEHFKTPCMITSRCHACRSPDRICNHLLGMERRFPAGPTPAGLHNQEPGL